MCQKRKLVNTLIENFLWSNQKPKIKTEILCKPKDLGGLGLVDLDKRHQALASKWIKIINMNKECYHLANCWVMLSKMFSYGNVT